MRSYLYFLFLCTAPCAVLALAVVACTSTVPKTYRKFVVLGTPVQCAETIRYNCGYTLKDCTVPFEFSCVTNLVEFKGESQ